MATLGHRLRVIPQDVVEERTEIVETLRASQRHDEDRVENLQISIFDLPS
jgi:hypothetical protein